MSEFEHQLLLIKRGSGNVNVVGEAAFSQTGGEPDNYGIITTNTAAVDDITEQDEDTASIQRPPARSRQYGVRVVFQRLITWVILWWRGAGATQYTAGKEQRQKRGPSSSYKDTSSFRETRVSEQTPSISMLSTEYQPTRTVAFQETKQREDDVIDDNEEEMIRAAAAARYAKTASRRMSTVKDCREIQQKFLLACMKGDLETVRSILHDDSVPLTFRDSCGFTPLHLTIKNGHEELCRLLLTDERIEPCDALHVAADTGRDTIAIILIDSGFSPNQPAVTDIYYRGARPLQLACVKDNTSMIQLLLERGAARLDVPDKRTITRATLQDCRSRIEMMKALACPSYIALTTTDPIARCFELAKYCRWLSNAENELSEQYDQIEATLERLAAAFVKSVEGTEDIMVLLSIHTTTISRHNDDPDYIAGHETTAGGKFSTDKGCNTQVVTIGEPLCRLNEALQGDHKLFVAHAHCQLALADEFIAGLTDWRHLSSYERTKITFIMVLATPIWMLGLIFLPPNPKTDKFLRIPLMKFTANIVCHVIFITIMTCSQIKFSSPSASDLQGNSFKHGTPITYAEILIFTWMIGSMYHELCEMANKGYKIYLQDLWNFWDFTIALTFCVASIARMSDAADVNSSKSTDRTTWTMYDNYLVYEAGICLGTLTAVNRILYYFSASRLLGKLQMSLGSSLLQITRFMALFLIMYLSFACAINSLYWKEQFIAINQCEQFPHDSKRCPPGVKDKVLREQFQFTTLGGCLYQLYWTLFGYSNLVFASKVQDHWTLLSLVGSVLFIMFNFLAVVVLLNVLVGMITKTLDGIEENIDTEWKFARSGIYADFLSENDCLPSPFNIIPSVRKIMFFLARVHQFITKDNRYVFKANWALKNKLKKQDKARERLPDLLKTMKDQYMRRRMKTAEGEEITTDDLTALKNDVSGLKFELLGHVKNVPKVLNQMSGRQDTIVTEIRNTQHVQQKHTARQIQQTEKLKMLHEEHSQEILELTNLQKAAFEAMKHLQTIQIDNTVVQHTENNTELLVDTNNVVGSSRDENMELLQFLERRQLAMFTDLYTEQMKIKEDQQKQAQMHNLAVCELKRLIEEKTKSIEQLTVEQREQFHKMKIRQMEMINDLRDELHERQKQHNKNMLNLHEKQLKDYAAIYRHQQETSYKIQTEFHRMLQQQVESLREFYETKLEEMAEVQRSLVTQQSELLRLLITELKAYFLQTNDIFCSTILHFNEETLPSVFRNESNRIVDSADSIIKLIEKHQRQIAIRCPATFRPIIHTAGSESRIPQIISHNYKVSVPVIGTVHPLVPQNKDETGMGSSESFSSLDWTPREMDNSGNNDINSNSCNSVVDNRKKKASACL